MSGLVDAAALDDAILGVREPESAVASDVGDIEKEALPGEESNSAHDLMADDAGTEAVSPRLA